MRFEAKNKECKQDAQKSNFKNVCKTVAEQHQRRHSLRLHELFCENPVTIIAGTYAKLLMCGVIQVYYIHIHVYLRLFCNEE